MKQSAASEVKALISKLMAERQEYQKAILEIDEVFGKFGIKNTNSPIGKRKVGRPRKTETATKKKRGRSKKAQIAVEKETGPKTMGKRGSVSGQKFIMNYLKAVGADGSSTSEIVKNWQGAGRKGAPYRAICNLVNAGKLKRCKLKGQLGSKYCIA